MTKVQPAALPWVLAATAVLAVALVVGRDAVAWLWEWLGWWHWVVLLAVVAAVAAVGRLALAATAADAPASDPGARRRAAQELAAAAGELERALALTQPQLELEVSRCLRRDGWADAHVEAGGAHGSLVVSHRGAATLLVRCKQTPTRVLAGEVLDLVRARDARPGAVAVFLTTGQYAASALDAARAHALVPMDGEDAGRWLALGPAAWPVAVTASR